MGPFVSARRIAVSFRNSGCDRLEYCVVRLLRADLL